MRVLLFTAWMLAACTTGGETEDTQDTSVDTGEVQQPPPCGEILTFETEPTAWLHVSTSGSDSTGDGSEGSPFASIEHAAGQATPGTAVVVHSGDYAGGHWIENLSGTEQAPIWIGGARGETKPHIQGGSQALHLVRASWVILHDLEISGQSSNGINADDGGDYADDQASHHLVFRDLHIHDVGSGGNQDCLKLSGLRNYWVLDSEMHHCGGGSSGSAIDHVGCHHGLIARNSLHDLSANAVQNKGGSSDIEIRWNKMVDAGARAVNLGGSTGYEYFRPPLDPDAENAEATDIRVVSNLIQGSEAAVAYVGCVDCAVVGNTIIDPQRWVIRILQETTSDETYDFAPARNGVFVDNLVYADHSRLSTWVNIGADTSPETFTFAHDLWYTHDDPSASQPELPVDQTNAVIGLDPSFVDGWEIDASSPAAGAGTAHQALPSGDIEGTCYTDPPSIGAWEVIAEP